MLLPVKRLHVRHPCQDGKSRDMSYREASSIEISRSSTKEREAQMGIDAGMMPADVQLVLGYFPF